MKPRKLAGIVALGFLFAATRARAFPWSIDMYRGPEVQPLTVSPRVMPEGTLPIDRGEPPMSVEQAATTLHNPLKPTADVIAEGRSLYESQCTVCHGATGAGDGSVVHLLQKRPDNLVDAHASAWSDGFIYGVIRNGHGYMPPMGDALTPDERWAVILYTRGLHSGASVSQVGSDAQTQAAGQ